MTIVTVVKSTLGSICSLAYDNIVVENFYPTVWYVNVNTDIGTAENNCRQPNYSGCQQQVVAGCNLVLKRQNPL